MTGQVPPTGPSLDAFDFMLPYRFAPRPDNSFLVPRKDLLRHLTEAGLLKQLAIVRGPAGAGKTTLLSQWRSVAQQMDRPLAWLTIDAADRDLEYLVAGLAKALESAGCEQIAAGFHDIVRDIRECPVTQIAQRLASVCNRSNEHPVIVLDQYENMDGGVAAEVISAFLHHAVHVRMVIASRIRPSLPLGGLRARDQLFEIGPSDLNLTAMETRAIFEPDIPELFSRRLHLETSGEAVAVGFARRVFDELHGGMIGNENWHEQLHEYYRAEVLGTLGTDVRDAMSRLVVVERFDLSLARALAGPRAAEMIERLHHVDGLLLRHRGTQEFYFSEMLRRFLEKRLAWLEEDEQAQLHLRASRWFRERGLTSEALRHAIAAGDRPAALSLLEGIGYVNLVTQQGVTAAHRLLDAIGATSEMTSPAALLSLALVHAHEGDTAQAAANLAEASAQLDGGPDDDPVIGRLRARAEAMMAGFRDETLKPATAAALEQYLSIEPGVEHEERAQAQTLLSWERFRRGDVVGAEALTQAAAREYAETEGAYGCLYMYAHSVLARFWLSDLKSALDDITLAERMTRIFFPEDQRLRAMTNILRAGLLFEMGPPDPLTDMTALVGAVAAVESWTEIQIFAHTLGARAALAQGQISEARAIVAYGHEVARRLDAPRFGWHMHAASLNIALRTGDLADAGREAHALEMSDATFLGDAHPHLTWQEQIAGLFLAIRLAEAEGDGQRARTLAKVARTRISLTSASRYAVELELCLARLAHNCGDPDGAQAHVLAAEGVSDRPIPVRLFVEAGPELGPYRRDLSAWDLTEILPAAMDAEGAPRPRKDDPLTARERQIMLFMSEGHPNKVAAHRLGLSEATVKFHLRNIYRKLHAQNRTQALARYRTFSDIR